MSRKKMAAALLCGACLSLGLPFTSFADSAKVVTLGVDLSGQQKDMMMRYFNVAYSDVNVMYINNDQEREHLSSYVPLEQIGSRTFSCAYVKPTDSGGIRVKTANLSWVTCNMIASTLSTSGVTNCEVIAAAPFQVSGTGALTGILMAYESATGETLSETKKDLATEELVVTGELGDRIGQSDATALVNEAKMDVLSENLQDREEIQSKVEEVAGNKGVDLSSEEIETLTGLMEKMSSEDYDYDQMKDTLQMVEDNVSDISGEEITDDTNADDSEQPGEVVDDTTQETEIQDDILNAVDDSALGENVVSSSTDEKEVLAPAETETDISGEEIWEEDTQNFGAETEGMTEYVENIAPETEQVQKTETDPVEIPETELTEETNDLDETEDFGEEEEALKPEDLDAEDKDAYDKLVKYCEKTYNISDVDEDGEYKVAVDDETAKIVSEYLEKLFLSVKLDGVPEDYTPAEDAKYEDNDEINYLDEELEKFFVKQKDEIFDDYSEEERKQMYESVMKFFEKLYDIPQEEETEGLEELDTAAADEFQDFETESLDIEDLG